MKRAVISAITLAFFVPWTQSAAAQDLSAQLVGVWKYKSLINKELTTGKVTYPFGEKPPAGNLIYTKGGHVAFVLVGDNRKNPAGVNATDAERINLFNTMAAASGTYKVEGNTIIVTYGASWNQSWTGIAQKRHLEISGNELTATSDPVKNLDGQDIVFVATYERVE